MKFKVVNTTTGLVPETDEDFEIKRKLKTGATYEVSIKELRNPQFNRKFQAMITLAWEYLPEAYQDKFGSREHFRYMTEIKAGFCDMVYDPVSNLVTYRPQSTAFDKMSEQEFEQLYNGVLGVIVRDYVPVAVSSEMIEKLKWF